MAYSLAKPRGAADRASPDGRLPLPLEGPGGVATEDARRSERLIGNCRAGGHGQVMWVSRGGLPIGLPIGGYHHGTTRQAEGRHRARRREIGALGVRRHARGRAPGKQAHPQQGKRHRRALRSVPGRAGRRRPGPQHRLACAFARQVRRDAARVPARARRARRLEAVRRRCQDRRARRDGHKPRRRWAYPTRCLRWPTGRPR